MGITPKGLAGEWAAFAVPAGGSGGAAAGGRPAGRSTPAQRRPRVLRKVYWLAWGVCVAATAYYANVYRLDQVWLSAKAAAIVSDAGASTPEQETIALRNYVRRHVRFEGVDSNNRPYLRASARETLESGRGFCGEATRTFICLAHQRGIQAQRVNLYGKINHVVAEVLVAPNHEVLVDVQDNPQTNTLLDQEPLTVHQIDNDPRSPFNDYSNVHLRRFPVVGPYIQHIKLEQSSVTWVLENPSLLKALLWGGLALGMIVLFAADRTLVRIYARRFGLGKKPATGAGTS